MPQKYKYTVVGNFRQAHKDSEGDCLMGLICDEAIRIVSEWKKQKKYKEVFYYRED